MLVVETADAECRHRIDLTGCDDGFFEIEIDSIWWVGAFVGGCSTTGTTITTVTTDCGSQFRFYGLQKSPDIEKERGKK